VVRARIPSDGGTIVRILVAALLALFLWAGGCTTAANKAEPAPSQGPAPVVVPGQARKTGVMKAFHFSVGENGEKVNQRVEVEFEDGTTVMVTKIEASGDKPIEWGKTECVVEQRGDEWVIVE
jgi:hypothetical protein